MVPTGDPAPRSGGREGDGWVVWGESTEHPEAGTLERRIVLFRRAGEAAGAGEAAAGEAAGAGEAAADLYRRTDEVHVVRLHEPDDVLADLTAAGFAAERIEHYDGAEPFRAGVAGFVARKRLPAR
jgi:hypothetical protein